MFINLLIGNVIAQNQRSKYDKALNTTLQKTAKDSVFKQLSPELILRNSRKNYLIAKYALDGNLVKNQQRASVSKINYALAGVYYLLSTKEREALLTYITQTTNISISDFSDWLAANNDSAHGYFNLFLLDDYPLKLAYQREKEGKVYYQFNGDISWPLTLSTSDSIFSQKDANQLNKFNQNRYQVTANKDSLTLNSLALIPERNLLNNSSKTPILFTYSSFKKTPFTDEYFSINWRPDAWYNSYDGVKLGARIKTAHLSEWHKLDAGIYFSTGIAQADFESNQNDYQTISWFANYSTRLDDYFRNASFAVNLGQLDGLDFYGSELQLKSKNLKTAFSAGVKYMNRTESAYANYLFDSREWGTDAWNGIIDLSIKHTYFHNKGFGSWNIALRGSAPGSDYNYGYLSFESKNRQEIGSLPFRIRVYGRYGWGAEIAPESMLYLAGANPEERFDNPLSRSPGLIPQDWGTFSNEMNNFHESGGLNLRGFVGYFAPYQAPGDYQVLTYSGNSGAAVNVEFPFTELLNIHVNKVEQFAKFNSYLFGDLGAINANSPDEDFALASARADAGIGAYCEVMQWGKYTDINPICIRFDVPFWVNSPAFGQDYFEFRWVLGVSKTF